VLVVSTRHAGQYGDDLAKMPHMARIAGSVFDDIDASSYHQVGFTTQGSLLRVPLLATHYWVAVGADP
jgi:hypothetical protein